MTTLVFDTLMYANRLKEAGVPDKQAEVQVQIMAEITESKLATKQDIINLEHKIEHKFEKRLSQVKLELIKWVLGISVGQAAIIISCIKFIH